MTKALSVCARVLLGSTALIAATGAWAQTAPETPPAPGNQLEDVVVTAQKRLESLQNTPLSIVALTSADLEKNGVHNITDLQTLVPNLQLSAHPNSGVTTLIAIRGIGATDDQITQDPGAAIYLDGVYVARSQGLAMDVADIQRVEVLRGPQGTLYGRNAKAGAVNFITVPPKLGEFGFKEDLTLGNRSNFGSRTMVNIPVGQTIAVRLSYLYRAMDGFVANPGSNVARYGDIRRQAWRADVLWQPSDAFQARYSYDRSNIGDTPAYVARAPLYPAVTPLPTTGSGLVSGLNPNDVTAQGHSLLLTLNLDENVALKSITAYRAISNFQNENFLPGLGGNPLPVFRNSSLIEQHQWSEELQLVGNTPDKSLEYVAGFYYFAESGNLSSGTVTSQAPTVSSINGSTIDNKAYAFFGQATWSPAALDGRLHLTAGGRYSSDLRGATLARATQTLATGVIVNDPNVGAGKHRYSNFSPTGVIAYDVTKDINVFARVARGYQTGGFNTRASSIAVFNRGYGEETLTSWEAGVKSQFWDNRIRFNLTGFYSKYHDIQVNVQSDPTNPRIVDVLNAGRATIQGVELDAMARLARGLTLGLNYAYLDAKYNDVRDATGKNIAANFRFLSPKNSFNINLDYQALATPIGVFTFSGNYAWQDKKNTASNNPALIIGSYGLANARLTLSNIPGLERFRFAVWGKNLTDKSYYISNFQLGNGVQGALFGEPRTYGLEAIFEF
ncbi:TonB-dependent receptor [Sphingomonas sp. CL5.1]|uniref:TonB-dependent receptor n=1 Tax=Sphingomonas sp. CL5.1 TaxID=2653203 RepID=UPI0015820E4E|nr:TonB-dependent receptor [Sphingomonas sp. CL5.1]QKR99917.1 TonB-dependent receptor [Sphingomonas sp. CL5.1]